MVCDFKRERLSATGELSATPGTLPSSFLRPALHSANSSSSSSSQAAAIPEDSSSGLIAALLPPSSAETTPRSAASPPSASASPTTLPHPAAHPAIASSAAGGQPGESGEEQPQPGHEDALPRAPDADDVATAETAAQQQEEDERERQRRAEREEQERERRRERQALLRRARRRAGAPAERLGTAELAWRLARARRGAPPALEDLPASYALPALGGAATRDALDGLASPAAFGTWSARYAAQLQLLPSALSPELAAELAPDLAPGAERRRRQGWGAGSRAQVTTAQLACQAMLTEWTRARKRCVVRFLSFGGRDACGGHTWQAPAPRSVRC